mmetsp:Transcript_92779/g.184181  ORF Transcript_92779/g.184181 Transcript_92779/m.184181 type:complete len:296 (-) Transcript_92779:350-1237(-)
MTTLDPLSHGIHYSGSWLEKSNDHTATVTAVLPRLVQQLQDPRCAMVACKAGLFTGGAICDVLAVRAWLRWHGRVSSASTEETLRRSSQSCRSSMTAAATHGHKNVVVALLLAFGACVGCTGWVRRRAAVVKRRPQITKTRGTTVSKFGTSSTETFADRWEDLTKTPVVQRGTVNTRIAFQSGIGFEPEEEDSIGRKLNPVPGRAGFVAHRAAEFDNQVTFFRIFTEAASLPSETDSTACAGDVNVVPEGFVRARTQELVPEGFIRARTQELETKATNHGSGAIAMQGPTSGEDV